MSTRTQLIFTWCAPIAVLVILVGFWPIAGYLPPPPASSTAEQLATFYRDRAGLIRLGLVLSFAGCAAWGPLVAVITRRMLAIRPRNFTLIYGQLGAGIAAWGFLLVPLIVLAVAAFRPERSPETTQTLHDLGWMLLIMPFVPFTVQNACLGWAILQDNGTPPALPRWLGYFNLWVALSFMPGGVIPLFKTGPLAYNGVFAFWIPFSIFFIWLVVVPVMLHRAIIESQTDLDESVMAPTSARANLAALR
jgi:hypothetical protein